MVLYVCTQNYIITHTKHCCCSWNVLLLLFAEHRGNIRGKRKKKEVEFCVCCLEHCSHAYVKLLLNNHVITSSVIRCVCCCCSVFSFILFYVSIYYYIMINKENEFLSDSLLVCTYYVLCNFVLVENFVNVLL